MATNLALDDAPIEEPTVWAHGTRQEAVTVPLGEHTRRRQKIMILDLFRSGD
jgi:hypothetical protein